MKSMRKLIAVLIAGLGCFALAGVASAEPQPTVGYGQVLELGGGGVDAGTDIQWDDGVNVCLGTGSDYCWVYSPTDFALYSASLAANVLTVADGTDDVDFSGSLTINDNQSLRFGTGVDQTITYTDGTGVTWNDGTSDFLVIADDQTRSTTGAIRLAHGESLAWRNSVDSADISIGPNASNRLETGAAFQANGLWLGSADRLTWINNVDVKSSAAGRLTLASYNASDGVMLDVTTADTLTLKDQAGTGAGNLSVTGDLQVDGDQTYYGSMYINSTQTVTISVAATPVQVTTFTAGADLNGTSVASSELTITNAGTYMITASVSSNKASGATARTTKGYIYLDDGTPAALTGCQYWRSLAATNDVGSAAITCIATVAADDKLELWVENTDGTEDIEIQAATVTAHKL